jgi:DeoR family fructose operon transcriptional repressor
MKVVDFMFAEERHDKIMNMLNEDGHVKVTDISKFLNVSEATIRRDLQDMEEKKLLKRTHGGAIKLDITNFEPTFLDKKNKKHDEKVAIAKYAAKLINDDDTIILDSGTTTLEIAKKITAKNITVITNSIDIAAELSNKENLQLIVTGGSLRFSTRAMVGNTTVNVFKEFKVNKAFIGANGVSLEDGITTPNYIEAQTKRAMMKASNKVIVVADSSKFQDICFSVICQAAEVDSIITSGDISEEVVDKYKKEGVKIVVTH